MMAELFAVWAGATEADGIELRQWLQQRPLHASRSFVDFNAEDDGDDCGESLDAWDADYRAEMAAAGLSRDLVPVNCR